MNYFVTHCDRNYIKYAERLFESLEKDSENKILFFSVDFDYKNRFKNVISIRYDSLKSYNEKRNDLHVPFVEDCKSFHVFIKPLLVENILSDKYFKFEDADNFCYLDVDCFSRKACDSIFKNALRIKNYPLLSVACQQYMLRNGKGNPFINGGEDPNLTLEAPLLKKLNIDVNLRIPVYLQTGAFIFNKKCLNFVKEWSNLCFSDLIVNNWIDLAPFHEETVINCLLWRDEVKDNLGQSLINVIEGGKKELQQMLDQIKNPANELKRVTDHCTIPSKQEIDKLYFFHRRVDDNTYKFLTQKMKSLFLKVHSPSLGDTLACTPVLRKLYKSYNNKVTVVTHHKDIFKNNPYIDKVISFQDFEELNTGESEIFDSFLGVGQKNHLGVEKKHNAIDIRQFHAIDLGFCLLEEEMEYDYKPEEYAQIDDLPSSYIVLHVGSTWPSRTYSKDNWQQLINLLNYNNIPVVLVGKNDHETGFYDIDKKTINLNVNLGLDLTNQLNLSQCWHVINKAACLVTMDSGLLHLAGTTDTYIVQLGSSLNNKLRAPFRKSSQNYKYKYISGPCDIFCASNIKYGVKEWGTIQGVPPLIGCLENKPTFECHPNPQDVFNFISNDIIKKESIFSYVDFSYENNRLALNYSLSDPKYIDKYNIVIEEEGSGIVIYQELVNVSHAAVNFWTDFTFAKSKMNENFKVRIFKDTFCVFEKSFSYPDFNPSNPLINLTEKLKDFNLSGVSLGVISEVFIDNNYDEGLVKVSKGDVVVDIGFNVGLFSLKSFLEGAKKIYAVEPNEQNISKFKSINKNNIIDNLHVSNIAISDHDGVDNFLVDEDYNNSGRSMLEKTLHSGRTSFNSHSHKTVKTQKFQTFLEQNNIDKIDLLKIDCEGGELFILHEDNKKIFEEKINKVVGEIHFSLDTKQGSYMKNFLEEAGFEFSIDAGPDPAGLITFSAIKKKIKKILFLAPHLSTGGSPSYLLWLIKQKLAEGYEVSVIEYCYYGDYTVQRDEIIKLVGESNFYSFATFSEPEESYIDRTDILIDKIKNINPSEIHLNEVAEIFALRPLTEKLKDFIYSEDRVFKVYETCHTSEFNFENKKHIPDEFYFCSPYHIKISEFLNVPKKLVEMKIETKERPDRSEALSKLNLPLDYYHVLNVGLFMENKNQKYLFDLAEKLLNKKVMFHFVGNTCFLEDCDISEFHRNLKNCVIHGEKDNVQDFMAAMDLFVFPSTKELNPISIKEALSWQMPCYINDLEVYGGSFDDNELVTYLHDDNLYAYLNSSSLYKNNLFLKDENKFSTTSSDYPKVEILGDKNFNYKIEFFNKKDQICHGSYISTNMWSNCMKIDRSGFAKITNLTTEEITKIYFDAENIINESGSLGDCLAWLPIVNAYATKNNIKVNYFTPLKHVFNSDEYPLINFFDYAYKNRIKNKNNTFSIGCFNKKEYSKTLQKVPADILKIDLNKIEFKKPLLNPSFIKEKPFDQKYVCIAVQSTAQLKYWNNFEGWDQTVNYLKGLGYEVVCIDKNHNYGNAIKTNYIPQNCIHYPGNSISDVINCLHHCDFMIGLSSGLSWLAWACNKPVIMICGFLKPEYHFETPYYVQNLKVCNSCWHNDQHEFDPKDWLWCPENKDFECSKEISFEMVKDNIDNLISDNNL